jgi:hypothetical protein
MIMRHRWGGGEWARSLALASSMLLAPASVFGQNADDADVRPTPDTTETRRNPDTAGVRRNPDRASTESAAAAAEQGQVSQPTGGFKNWIEQRVRSFSSSTDREKGITASVGTVTPGSGIAGGIGYKHFNAFGPGIGYEAGGKVSFRRYQQYSVAFGRLNDRASTVELDTADRRVGSLFNDSATKERGSALYIETRYRDFPQSVYYGGGSTSLKSDRADYSLSGISIEGVWQRQFDSSVGLSVRGGLLDLRVGTGTNAALVNFEERFAGATIPGAVEQPRFITLGAGLVRDTRQYPGAPDDGTFVGVALRRFAASGAPDLDFTRMTLDLRAYAKPITDRGVLAVRALLSSDFTDSGGPTPFYLQQSLGGGDTIRGLPSYRFQDQALYVLTTEYRWRAHRHLEVAPFIDVGNTAAAVSRLTLHSLKIGPGLAIRVRTNRRTLARLEWATSSEGYRIVVSTGPSF